MGIYSCMYLCIYRIQMLYEKKILNIFCECESDLFFKTMFLANAMNAKSNFGAIFLLFYGISRIFWENCGFSYANQLWKIRFLLCKIGPSLFAFVKHLDTYGMYSCFYVCFYVCMCGKVQRNKIYLLWLFSIKLLDKRTFKSFGRHRQSQQTVTTDSHTTDSQSSHLTGRICSCIWQIVQKLCRDSYMHSYLAQMQSQRFYLSPD